MSFSHKYNADDSVIRASIVGLINELNNRIYFENIWSDNEKKTVRVPFFYAMSGDERFLQDYFSNWSDCAPDFIEGNTDPIPRGTIFLTGTSIMSANLTSRYVRGFYTKEIDGEMKRFSSYINSIPVQLNFSAEIIVDTVIDSFKIVESIFAVLYRTIVFSVNHNGFRIPTQAGFPDSYNSTKQFEYTYGVTDHLKVTFDIELQTYFPIPDPKEVRFAGNVIDKFNGSITPGKNEKLNEIDFIIKEPLGLSGNEANYRLPSINADGISEINTGTGFTGPDDMRLFSGNYWQ